MTSFVSIICLFDDELAHEKVLVAKENRGQFIALLPGRSHATQTSVNHRRHRRYSADRVAVESDVGPQGTCEHRNERGHSQGHVIPLKSLVSRKD
jgi:hypothetical protein